MGIISDALNGAKSIASQVGDAVSNGLINLVKFLEGEAPTSSLTAPSDYVPPFSGGQCAGDEYYLAFTRTGGSQNNTELREDGTPIYGDARTRYFVLGAGDVKSASYTSIEAARQAAAFAGVAGKIGGILSDTGTGTEPNRVQTIVVATGSGNQSITFNANSGFVFGGESYVPYQYAFNGAIKRNGSQDTCGDIPDSNPSSPQSNPIPISAAVGIGDAFVIAIPDLFIPTPSIPVPPAAIDPPEAIPPATTEGIAAALPAILGNLAAALNAIKNVVDILNGIKDLIDKLSKKDGKKEIKLFPLGLATKDGYINLQSVIDAGYVPYKVNILITRLPPFLSKEIGDRIPFNYYNGLGRIQSVDGGFHICSFDRIQHIRQSVFLKEDSVGFYYSFGREDKITAQLTLLAIKDDQ